MGQRIAAVVLIAFVAVQMLPLLEGADRASSPSCACAMTAQAGCCCCGPTDSATDRAPVQCWRSGSCSPEPTTALFPTSDHLLFREASRQDVQQNPSRPAPPTDAQQVRSLAQEPATPPPRPFGLV